MSKRRVCPEFILFFKRKTAYEMRISDWSSDVCSSDLVMNTVGVPEGVYNVVHGFGSGSAGEYLTTNKDVDAITFTGETGTGQAIMQKAAIGVRDVSFELGGKNAAKIGRASCRERVGQYV